MEIKIFGPGCARCRETESIVSDALKEAGADAVVEKVRELREIMSAGVMSTPALAIDGKVLCTGRVPSKEEVIAWFAKS